MRSSAELSPLPQISVAIVPGSTQATQMSQGRSSWRIDALIRWIAPFEPQ